MTYYATGEAPLIGDRVQLTHEPPEYKMMSQLSDVEVHTGQFGTVLEVNPTRHPGGLIRPVKAEMVHLGVSVMYDGSTTTYWEAIDFLSKVDEEQTSN